MSKLTQKLASRSMGILSYTDHTPLVKIGHQLHTFPVSALHTL